MQPPLLITVSSWENRFDIGFKQIVENLPGQDVEPLVFTFIDHHLDETRERVQIAKSVKEFEDIEMFYEKPEQTWSIVKNQLSDLLPERKVLLDFSTMPRHLIWMILRFLEERKSESVDCIYHRPQNYGDNWVTKNPGPPRIAYKLGGELEIGAKTVLLILAGYDEQRVFNLINSFEPDEILLGIHKDDSKDWQRAINKDTIDFCGVHIKQFEYDAFDKNYGFDTIQKECQEYFSEGSNVLLASLGPKPTAISLYRLNREHSNSALIYVPAKDFNLNYSQGIKQQCRLTMSFSK
jgi:hypothetical protein